MSDEKQIVLINTDTKKQLPPHYLSSVLKNSDTTHTVSDVTSLNSLVQQYYTKALVKNFCTVQNSSDVIVIESYADQSFYQWQGLRHFDLVLAIEPWRLLCYDPAKYEKALKLSHQLHFWEISTRKLVELLQPVKTISLSSMPSKSVISYLESKVETVLDF